MLRPESDQLHMPHISNLRLKRWDIFGHRRPQATRSRRFARAVYGPKGPIPDSGPHKVSDTDSFLEPFLYTPFMMPNTQPECEYLNFKEYNLL